MRMDAAVAKEVTSERRQGVAERARQLLADHPHFRGRSGGFEFSRHNEVLLVRGQVPSYYLKQVLQCALRDVAGIRRIDNRVDVVCPDGLSSVRRR